MSQVIYDLSQLNLSVGTHTVKVKATAPLQESEYTDPITLTVCSISASISNGTCII